MEILKPFSKEELASLSPAEYAEYFKSVLEQMVRWLSAVPVDSMMQGLDNRARAGVLDDCIKLGDAWNSRFISSRESAIAFLAVFEKLSDASERLKSLALKLNEVGNSINFKNMVDQFERLAKALQTLQSLGREGFFREVLVPLINIEADKIDAKKES